MVHGVPIDFSQRCGVCHAELEYKKPDTIILDIAEDDTVVGMELRAVSTWLTEAKESVPEPQETGRLVYFAA